MGDQVDRAMLTVDRRQQVSRRLADSVTALRTMIADGWFTGHRDTFGAEVELDLVDPLGRPRPVNDAVLATLDRPDVQHELGRFTVELNLPPAPLAGDGLAAVERQLSDFLAAGRTEPLGARIAAIGILPTVGAEDLTRERISSPSRYAVLAERMRVLRHGPVVVNIVGPEPLRFSTDSIAPEGAATSLQLHLRVPPADFVAYYNATQAIAGAQLAVGANSPFLLGHELWHETRIPLCEQVLDTRRSGAARAGEPPRVWLGDSWLADPLEIFDADVRRVPPVLPTLTEQDPLDCVASGMAPRLPELRLHNGTVWRWNRPVYDVVGGVPHLRIENRVLPSGPTAVDMAANAAFYFGLVRSVATADCPLWSVQPFGTARRDMLAAARHGPAAWLHWDGAEVPATRLVLDVLLPLAAAGLDDWGTAAADRDRLLAVVAGRVRSGRTGACWQTTVTRQLQERSGLDRQAALREMTRRYVENAHTGAPVHEWPTD